jgi:predicted nucleic acid-binding protein
LRFVDASVFLHAYLRPAKKLPPEISALKAKARAIVRRISEGEQAATSLVHISEIANILEARASLNVSLDILSGFFTLPNLVILEPSTESYQSALEESRAHGVGVNDALAIILMREEGISEIYSFDRDYDKLKNVKRVAD